jgi:D-arginine dehydrogenase
MTRFDVAIVGAGMAGASLAAELAPHRTVLLLEAEDAPGYHSTGRSAAFWSETYGGPLVQPLTTASEAWFRAHGVLRDRGALHLGRVREAAMLDDFLAEFAGTGVRLERWGIERSRQWLPTLATEWDGAVWEPSCTDIDVAGAHQAFLTVARRAGAELVAGAPLTAAAHDGDWTLRAGGESYRAGVLVNAAGAWADRVAALAGARPIGIQPYRRTVVQLRVDPPAPADLPLVRDIAGSFYFKPEAGGRLWLSPHDETPDEPCDVAPDELDVAIAIDRFERATGWRILTVERRWAGLRSFAPDRLPVYGFDPAAPGFFWCAGQGGFGIQTAPAAARMAAALLLGREPELDAAPYRPERFR